MPLTNRTGRTVSPAARVAVLLVAAGFLTASNERTADAATGGAGSRSKKPSLKEALRKLKVPPGWFKTTKVGYDTRKPWKEARLEIRRLLGGDRESARQGMKLTYMYRRKGDIGDGHEFPMYLFLGGEYAWALKEYEKRLAPAPKGHTHEYLSLASCYTHFGEYARALKVLSVALQRLPAPPWHVARKADIHDHLGDVYAETGDAARAKRHYGEAVKLYPTSPQPYGRHLLPKRVAKVKTKLALLAYRNVRLDRLRDGQYRGTSLGYKGDITATVTVRARKIADIDVRHKEDIEQGATKIVPERIIAARSLVVDGVTGATATSDAIVAATYEALKAAGLK
jgi:fumarate reductase flavoprotein subunit